MRVEDLIERAVAVSCANSPDLHKLWVRAQHNLAQLAGPPTAISAMFAASTDLLLRQLDKERLERMGITNRSKMGADNLSAAMSEDWMSRIYEILRRARVRARGSGLGLSDQLLSVFRDAELVRMATDKGEVAKMDRKSAPILMVGPEDDAVTKKYCNDGSYIIPRTVCGATGSMMWICIDITEKTQKEVCRADVSDRLLAALADI